MPNMNKSVVAIKRDQNILFSYAEVSILKNNLNMLFYQIDDNMYNNVCHLSSGRILGPSSHVLRFQFAGNYRKTKKLF